jgi:hypothetical protein
LTRNIDTIPKEDASGSASAECRDEALGAPSDQSDPKEGDIAIGCTIQFSDYSRQVAWDRFWDQMYALMLPIVAAQTRERSPHTSAESDHAEEE